MFRLKSALMTAGLLGSLFGFACGPVSAQVALSNRLHPPRCRARNSGWRW
jgi:hypothetical protein